MKSYLYLLGILSLHQHQTEEYEMLSEEEKYYVDYVNNCLYHEDDKIMKACSNMMFLILKAYVSIGGNHELSEEEVNILKSKILEGLTEEEKQKVEYFGYACIQTIGVYSEERKLERRLKKEKGND